MREGDSGISTNPDIESILATVGTLHIRGARQDELATGSVDPSAHPSCSMTRNGGGGTGGGVEKPASWIEDQPGAEKGATGGALKTLVPYG